MLQSLPAHPVEHSQLYSPSCRVHNPWRLHPFSHPAIKKRKPFSVIATNRLLKNDIASYWETYYRWQNICLGQSKTPNLLWKHNSLISTYVMCNVFRSILDCTRRSHFCTGHARRNANRTVFDRISSQSSHRGICK